MVATKRMAASANSEMFQIPGSLPTNDCISFILTVNVLMYKGPYVRGVIELLFSFLLEPQIWGVWFSLVVFALPS